MKYKVQLLNYDSEWVDYCNAPTHFYALAAVENLHHHGFKDFQIKLVKL